MSKEFEVDYASRICARFGLVYYGCCDPLDGKMAEVRLIPNVRKVSMRARVDQELGASEVGGDFVFSRKPNPATLATDDFHAEQVRADLKATKAAADIVRELKKASSVWASENHEPLFGWQDGYAVFSVSASQKDRVAAYIAKQEGHHRRRSFREELETLLRRHGIEFKPEYLE